MTDFGNGILNFPPCIHLIQLWVSQLLVHYLFFNRTFACQWPFKVEQHQYVITHVEWETVLRISKHCTQLMHHSA